MTKKLNIAASKKSSKSVLPKIIRQDLTRRYPGEGGTREWRISTRQMFYKTFSGRPRSTKYLVAHFTPIF